MEQLDYLRHWVRTGERDWLAADHALAAGDYAHALFAGDYAHALLWVHLATEKMAKAVWLYVRNEQIPPFWHNIAKLIATADLAASDELLATAAELSGLQTETRYPDITSTFYDQLTATQALALRERAALLRQWLRNKLPSTL